MSNDLKIEEMKIRTKEEMEELEYYARKGEIYDDLIDMMKVRIGVDEGLLDEEVKSLLSDAKNEIIKIRTDMNKMIDENLTIKSDASEMAEKLYLHELCENHGIKGKTKKIVFQLLEGTRDKELLDSKFAGILEQFKDKYIKNALDKIKSKKDKMTVANFFGNYGKDIQCSKQDVDGAVKTIIEMGK